MAGRHRPPASGPSLLVRARRLADRVVTAAMVAGLPAALVVVSAR